MQIFVTSCPIQIYPKRNPTTAKRAAYNGTTSGKGPRWFKSSCSLCSLHSLMQYNSEFEIFFCIVKLKYYSILAGYQTWWGFHKPRVLVTCRRSRVSVLNDQTHTQQWHFIFFTVLIYLFCVNKISLTIIHCLKTVF